VNIQSVLATKGTRVVTVRPDALVEVAAALLAANDIGALVVVDAERKLLGIISERDIARAVTRRRAIHDLRVRDLMTGDVTNASLTDEVVTVLRWMTLGRFRHVPVLDGEELAGIVSIGDLVRAQLSEDQGVILTLETMLMDAPR
jgi:CBS domain-containing protein